MPPHAATFRFYAELNDFLAPAQRQRPLDYRFAGHPGIKDPIEALGVPHSEVDLIIVNDRSVGFDYLLRDGDRVAVYPVFEALDITPLVRLRPAPLRETRFVVDVNLGKLARMLRMLGFDTLYRNDYADREIVEIAATERRIILTRDRRLLHAKAVSHGFWVRATDPADQLAEVIRRCDLGDKLRPFERCSLCNGRVGPIAKAAVIDRIPPKTARYYSDFYQCSDCGKVYWEGPHLAGIRHKLDLLGG